MKKILTLTLLLILSLSSCKKFVAWTYEVKGVAEEGRREVFEKSRAYNVGAEQELADYYGQYQMASNEDKKIIANTVKLAFSSYNEEEIRQPELRAFLKEMKYGTKGDF